MNFKYLCQQYNLGRFRQAAELASGTSSQVWRLDTDLGAFLVRTLGGREQGEREQTLFRHLRSRGFTAMPTLLVPCFEQGGVWYQVQEFVRGTMPDPAAPGMAAAMAELAKALMSALADCPGGPMIHGDLGPWNLLLCEDGALKVIDFGAARPGDPYFDYAALFGGVINHSPDGRRAAVCGEFLRVLDCDRARLLEQLRRWAEQGIGQWSGKSENMVTRFNHALNWAEEHVHDL